MSAHSDRWKPEDGTHGWQLMSIAVNLNATTWQSWSTGVCARRVHERWTAECVCVRARVCVFRCVHA